MAKLLEPAVGLPPEDPEPPPATANVWPRSDTLPKQVRFEDENKSKKTSPPPSKIPTPPKKAVPPPLPKKYKKVPVTRTKKIEPPQVKKIFAHVWNGREIIFIVQLTGTAKRERLTWAQLKKYQPTAIPLDYVAQQPDLQLSKKGRMSRCSLRTRARRKT